MGEFENAIADGVVGDLDAGEAPAAHQGTFAPGGGPGTSTMNYAPGTSQTGGLVAPLNGGSGTTLGVAYTDPGGAEDTEATEDAEDAEAREERARMLAEAIAQAKLNHAAADRSFRAFCKGGRPESGYVAGLEFIQDRQDRERNDK